MRSLLIAVFLLFGATADAQVSPAPMPPPVPDKTAPQDTSGKVLVVFNNPQIEDPDYWAQHGWATPTVKTPSGLGTYVDLKILEESFRELMRSLGGVFTLNNAAIPGGFAVDSVELHLAVMGDGKVGLFGSGATLGGEASLTVTLKRPTPTP